MANNPDYWFEHLSRALVTIDSDLSPPELHGAVTGLVSAGHLTQESQATAVISELLGSSIQEHALLIETLFNEIHDALAAEDFGLVLLIAEEPAQDRLQGLAHWCQGFLLGLGWGAIKNQRSSETQQAIDDLVEISRVSLEDPIDPTDLESVVEYVRLAAHLVCMET